MWQPGQHATSSETECLNAQGCSLGRALERGPQSVLPSSPSILDWILPGCRLKGKICDDATLYKESTPRGNLQGRGGAGYGEEGEAKQRWFSGEAPSSA